jgi:hypothetical protein
MLVSFQRSSLLVGSVVVIFLSALAALALQIGVPQNPANRTAYDTFLQGIENQQNARAPGQPVFLKTPDATDLQKVYPADALAKHVPGKVTIIVW